MSFETDKKWSDQYLTEIKSILGVHLIGPAPEEEDRHHNTDLIVLKMEAVRIGCRIRRAEDYLNRYKNEFTLRSKRPNGETELSKILAGWGNYFFYGFAFSEESRLCRWTLADLNIFRGWFVRQTIRKKGVPPGIEKPNKDGSSVFRVFRWDELPAGFIKAKGESVPEGQEEFAWLES